MSRSLSAGQARRITLAAQGLAAPSPGGVVNGRALRALARRLGAIQLDSVNVFVRAHYMPPFARLGSYPPQLLETEAWGRRPSLFEYWGHAAALMPVELQPLWRWKMERVRTADGAKMGLVRFAREKRAYIDAVLAEIGRRGPVTGGDFAEGPRQAGWWNWSDGKSALEWLFAAGLVAVKTRRGFERVYDLTERVIPPEVLSRPTPSAADAQRELIRLAAAAMGVANLSDLADYFRLPVAESRARVAELVETGELEAVSVQGWRGSAFLWRGARVPRRVSGAALLAPFDNLIWRRDRTERLFGVRYRIEIYTPAHRREHGYYVYLFLMGDAVAARVDLKADRKTGRLMVQAAHLEAGQVQAEVAGALARQLSSLAAWQGLADVEVAKKGGLSAALSKEIG
jgi:uncharacterized protein YcaQ